MLSYRLAGKTLPKESAVTEVLLRAHNWVILLLMSGAILCVEIFRAFKGSAVYLLKHPKKVLLALFLITASFIVAPHGIAESQLGQVDRLAALYHIQVQTNNETFPVRNNHGLIEGSNPAPNALLKYLPLFLTEFTKYPTDVIARSGLKTVVLCEHLKFAGQLRSAIPDYLHETLYLDVSRGIETPDYMRTAVHHEFFHIIDWKDDGSVYQDPAWLVLNQTGFRYGTGGKYAQNDDTVSLVNDSLRGFLTRYAMTGVEEDKSEMFAHMMTNYGMVQQRAKNDPVLQSKFVQMKALCKKFSPSMDEAFWSKMSERQ